MAPMSIEDYVAKVVAEAPPLSPEQRDRIGSLLRPTPEQMAEAEKRAAEARKTPQERLIERLAEGVSLDD